MVKERSVWGTIANASFLLTLIIAFVFLYAWSFTDNSIIFGELASSFFKIYTVYAVGLSLTLTGLLIFNPTVIKNLAKANLWKSFAFRFIPSAIVTSLFFIVIKIFIEGGHSSIADVIALISLIPIPVLLTHLIVVSQMEELLFGGLIYPALENNQKRNERSATIITTGLFSLWHLAKSGGQFIILIPYIPLRLWWLYVRKNGTWPLNKIPGIGQKFFGSSEKTQQANAGSHFGWNAFVIGFIEPFRI